ncbi:MAG: DNA repair protein RecO, partial [Kiritimatiellia bacterium]
QLRRDWRAAARASYLACLANTWLPQQTAQPGLFRLLDGALDRLAEDSADDSLVHWFELRLLELAGLAPRLTDCLGCRQPASARGAWCFSAERGGLLCAGCRTNAAAEMPVAPDVLGLLGFWQKAGAWEVARRARSRPSQRLAAGELLGAFLRRHLEGAAHARDIMLELTA